MANATYYSQRYEKNYRAAMAEYERQSEMQDGTRVAVQLSGDPGIWYHGTVIKARERWVELEDYPEGAFIADRANIVAWRPASRLNDE